MIGGEGLHPIDRQCRRIEAIRKAVGPDFFINARTDLFLKTQAYDDALVAEAVDRGKALCRRRRQRLLRPAASPTRARPSGWCATCRCRST